MAIDIATSTLKTFMFVKLILMALAGVIKLMFFVSVILARQAKFIILKLLNVKLHLLNAPATPLHNPTAPAPWSAKHPTSPTTSPCNASRLHFAPRVSIGTLKARAASGLRMINAPPAATGRQPSRIASVTVTACYPTLRASVSACRLLQMSAPQIVPTSRAITTATGLSAPVKLAAHLALLTVQLVKVTTSNTSAFPINPSKILTALAAPSVIWGVKPSAFHHTTKKTQTAHLASPAP